MEELRTRHQQFCAAGGSALSSPGSSLRAFRMSLDICVQFSSADKLLYCIALPRPPEIAMPSEASHQPAGAATAMADSDEELSVRELYRRWERAAGLRLNSSGSKGAMKGDAHQPKGHARRRKHGRGEDSSPAAAAGETGAAPGAQSRPHEEALANGSDQVSVAMPACGSVPLSLLWQDPARASGNTSSL